MTNEIHYIANCPVCGQGLVRIRVCTDSNGKIFGCVVCDECDSTWTDPSLKTSFEQTDPEQPVCPKSDIPIWSKSCHWADKAEMSLLGWYKRGKK